MIAMRFNSVKGGNFTSAAKAVNRSADQMFAASRESAPDFTGISKAAIASRTKERNAATQSQGLKDIANIKGDNLIERTKLDIKTKKDVADIKRPAKRMAGVVAGLGSISTAAVLAKDNREAKAERLKFKAERDALNSQMVAGQEASNAKWQEILKSLNKSGGTEGVNTPGEVKTDTPAVPSTPQPPSTSSGSTSFTPSTSTGNMSSQFKKIYDLAVKDGRSRFPEIVAAQAMHETGHLSPDISSVYNSSGGKNPFGQTGDRGYGTMTRKGDPGGWSSFPDLQTAVSDHITLWHDTGNHADNYNAHSTVAEGLSKVIPAYSPNSDPANQSAGFTESAYSSSVKKILRDNGFNV